MILRFVATVILAAGCAAGQAHRAELFDTSGMPRRPTNFMEQQILDLIASHEKGDLAGAARIQRKLGAYYTEKRDEVRATAAFLRAAAAEESPQQGAVPERPSGRLEIPETAGSRSGTAEPVRSVRQIIGNYYGYEGRTLHTWEFQGDGTFLHTWIAGGAGTSVRHSERGTYSLSGNTLELRIRSTAGGFITPGVGGRSTVSGGASDAEGQVRRLTIEFPKAENGFVLDGIRLKPKSW